MTGRRLIVHGRVQGVFYRNWTVETARTLGLAGWVRNRRDGSVEIEVHGPADRIQDLVERCRQGPPAARVERIDEAEVAGPAPEGFTKRPTA